MTRKREYGFMLYLSAQEKKNLEKTAEEEDMSQARLVRKALTYYLEEKLNKKTFIIKK